MFEFPCIITLYYIKDQQDETLAVLFISHCKNYCTRFGRFLRSLSGVLDIYHPDTWHTSVAATTVFSTPDDGRRKRPKRVQ
jgi:hypothetical protein